MPAPRRSRVGGSVPWANRREPLVATIPGWMEGAACTDPTVDAEIFFPPKGESAKPGKEVCLSCDQRVTCLNWAMETDQDEFGTLGGKTVQERRKLKREALKAAAAQQDAPVKAIDPREKRCFGCDEVKSFEDFHLKPTANDGRQSKCKTCRLSGRRRKRAEVAA